MLLALTDPRLHCHAPQPVVGGDAIRLERFPRAAHAACAGRIGPVANLRSSTGCGLSCATDSPWVEVRLERLRHHQPIPQSLALEVLVGGRWQAVESPDLRESEGDLTVRLHTGQERGGGAVPCVIWLPPISTVALASIAFADGSMVEPWGHTYAALAGDRRQSDAGIFVPVTAANLAAPLDAALGSLGVECRGGRHRY